MTRDDDRVDWPGLTLHDVPRDAGGRASLWGRRAFLVGVAAVVLAGLSSLLGTHTTTVTAQEGAWTVELRHADVGRAGLDAPFEVTVRHDGPFDGPVRLALTGDYLDIYETQGFTPEPSAATRDGRTLYLDFDPPPRGEVLVVAYDAYLQPASQVGADGTLGVADDGRVLAQVAFETRLLP